MLDTPLGNEELVLADEAQDSAAPDSSFDAMVLTPQRGPSQSRELSRLVAELELTGCLHNPDTLKSELQKIVLSLHPDKTGGAFDSDHDKARFMKARRAVELLNAGHQNEDASGEATPLPGAVRALGDASNERAPHESARQLQLSSMADARERIRRYFSAPKIGCAAAATLLLSLMVFADRFDAHPIFGPMLGNATAAWFLLAMSALSGLGFVTLWWAERSAESRISHLMSDAAVTEIFQNACRSARRFGRASQLSAFDIRHGIEILAERRGKRARPGGAWPLSPGLDLVTLESISAVQTQRLLERKVIKALNTPSIEILYQVSPRAMQA